MIFRFSKEYKNCPLDRDDRLNLTHVESHGRDLDDLLSNAMISLDDWHGNEGPECDFGSLSDVEQQMIQQDMVEFIAASLESASGRAECELEQRGRDHETVRGLNRGDL